MTTFSSKKHIKGERNISGALQKIRELMSGEYEFKQSSKYWIGEIQLADKKHPVENDEGYLYAPAIDGYYDRIVHD